MQARALRAPPQGYQLRDLRLTTQIPTFLLFLLLLLLLQEQERPLRDRFASV